MQRGRRDIIIVIDNNKVRVNVFKAYAKLYNKKIVVISSSKDCEKLNYLFNNKYKVKKIFLNPYFFNSINKCDDKLELLLLYITKYENKLVTFDYFEKLVKKVCKINKIDTISNTQDLLLT